MFTLKFISANCVSCQWSRIGGGKGDVLTFSEIIEAAKKHAKESKHKVLISGSIEEAVEEDETKPTVN